MGAEASLKQGIGCGCLSRAFPPSHSAAQLLLLLHCFTAALLHHCVQMPVYWEGRLGTPTAPIWITAHQGPGTVTME